MPGEIATDRRLWEISGKDGLHFLQGLVSNDVRPLETADGIVWAALLSPQGKYLADFFVVRTGGRLFIDISDRLAEPTLKRLTMYRLRADVQIAPLDLSVVRGLGEAPAGALRDPRHPALGWRGYGMDGGAPEVDWDAIRVAHLIPESGLELVPDDSYLLESGFERLHGVDFRKGCYVGQEVTARMKHKTELRKGLVRVRISGEAAFGAEITADGKPAGTLFTRSGDRAIAYVRHDRAEGEMRAGEAALHLDPLAE
ncbi:Glycine cleavage T protein [Cereibacter sphaeroides WS8N]|uniref:CAF17-like 4Fe-4S cluster assembly/insertion protein YgfZ n=1 Tax=Cereibacter sphaeroides TaxID=1063 RepID=UPI00020DF5D2|nr:folate-binding protein YgfZ [Cereibacter sphaeroides]EGJ21718.1 Glycine cleavage T protein [Cereibacter sphaeroides WS8N]